MSHCSWEGAVISDECEALIGACQGYELLEGRVGTEKEVDNVVRQVQVASVPENSIITRIMQSFVSEANNQLFKYNITGMDHVQFVKYTKGSFYDWHNDSTVSHNDGEEGIRKLSCVVQLSPPEAYNGGEFQLYKGCMGEETPAIKKQGSVIVFDARDYHRVTEITEGCRFSLILWARGPNFI